MTRVLVTGANGFVGTALCERLKTDGVAAIGAVRSSGNPTSCEPCVVGDLDGHTNWRVALTGISHVVHLAARVHVTDRHVSHSLSWFREVNVAGTVNLARQAVDAGVRRFLFVSSIKVNGEHTPVGPFRPDDPPCPKDAYAQSKHEAEQALLEIGRRTGLEIVIVRPPLVYGPGVKGNFLTLLRAVQREWPLPLASCRNRRSLIGLTNFIDLLKTCLTHPAATGEIFLASDGEDLSTPELLHRVAHALGLKPRLFRFPPSLLQLASRLIGRSSVYDRLCGSLHVDASKVRSRLVWSPPSTVGEELRRTALWYRSLQR